MPHDYKDRDFILAGIKDGFHIVNSDKINTPVDVDNYKSATAGEMRARTEAQIRSELDNGHYKIVKDKPTIVSALGAIPKKDSKNVRIIHDGSRPAGFSLNDAASTNHFQYQSIQDATDLVTPNCYFAKIDLSNAYRSVKIHQSNLQATGLKWKFKGDNHYTFMVDERMPFGGRKCPEIFNRITQSVRAMMAKKGFNTIVVYLDDFLIIAKTRAECQAAMESLLKLLRELGFAINYKKIELPTQKLVFLGILLDSTSMTISVPNEKIQETKLLLQYFMNARKVTKRQIQSLAGKLVLLTQCVYGGRFHLRRLFDRANQLRHPGHRSLVTMDMKQDIVWWLNFLDVFNGTMPMLDSRPGTSISIDSCQIAAGGFFNGECVYTPWSDQTSKLPINYLEVLALEPAIGQWAHQLANKKVYVHCDNVAAVSIINRGSCKNRTVMNSLRRVFWLSAIYNFRLKAVYYRGISNVLADSVSRLHEKGGGKRLAWYMRNAGYMFV